MKHTFILLLGAMLSLQGQAQDKQMQFQNTIKIEAGDNHADIIGKAAHVVPSPNQLAALQNEFIAFIHFGQFHPVGMGKRKGRTKSLRPERARHESVVRSHESGRHENGDPDSQAPRRIRPVAKPLYETWHHVHRFPQRQR